MTEYERMVIVAGTQWSTFRFVRNPTAADLLSDPRVAALVRALEAEVAALRALEEFGGRPPSDAVVAALAQFGLGGGE